MINNTNINFKRYGRPTNGRNEVSVKYNSTEKYDNESLIDSGIFVRTGSLIRFSSEFIDKAYKEYPSVSLNPCLNPVVLIPIKSDIIEYELKKA